MGFRILRKWRAYHQKGSGGGFSNDWGGLQYLNPMFLWHLSVLGLNPAPATCDVTLNTLFNLP